MVALGSNIIGIALGAGLVHCVRPRPRIITGYNVVLSVVGGLAFFGMSFVGCPSVVINGLDT